MTNFICEGEKYYLDGPKVDYLCLDVPLPGLPPSIEVEGHTLVLKTEFHVTLLAVGKTVEKYNIVEPDFLKKVINDFCNFVQSDPIELESLRDEFRFVEKDEKKTVVVMCDLKNFRKFIEQLNGTYSVSIECPPTHITLYSLDPAVGIGLANAVDIQTLTKVVTSPVTL